MATFNGRAKVTNTFNPMLNHEGSVVHGLSPLETLFSKVLASFFGESTAYEKRDAESDYKKLVELIEKVPEKDKEYVLKVAEIGRLCNMISYPVEILSACFHMDRYKGMNFLDEKYKRNKLAYYTDVIVRRVKDVNDIMATHINFYGFESTKVKGATKFVTTKEGREKGVQKYSRTCPIPKQMRVCLNNKLRSFDQFKLSKGLEVNSEVSLKDTIRLLHTKPRANMEEFFKRILGEVVAVSDDGKKVIRAEAVKVGNGKAVIRSEQVKMEQKKDNDTSGLKKAIKEDILQNILKNLGALYDKGMFNDITTLKRVCERLRDPKEIRNSKLLPMRYLQAYNALVNKYGPASTDLKDALSDALDLSIVNIDTIDGYTAILVDDSGSMNQHRVSGESNFTAKQMACLLGAIAYKKGSCDLFAFSNECRRVDISRKSTIMDIMKAVDKAVGSSGTYLYDALAYIEREAKQNNIKYDNLILLSDNDCYGYDERANTLTFRGHGGNADEQVNKQLRNGLYSKFWVNNLGGNDFAVVNTNQNTKNLIPGYSERFISLINVYNALGGKKDIRKVIDDYLDKLRANPKRAVED